MAASLLSRSLRRVFSISRPLYKRVSSSSANEGRRARDHQAEQEQEDEDEDDNDLYSEDDQVAHGLFVYCAFLMLGIPYFYRPFDN